MNTMHFCTKAKISTSEHARFNCKYFARLQQVFTKTTNNTIKYCTHIYKHWLNMQKQKCQTISGKSVKRTNFVHINIHCQLGAYNDDTVCDLMGNILQTLARFDIRLQKEISAGLSRLDRHISAQVLYRQLHHQ